LGVVLSTIVGYVLQAMALGVSLGRYVAGLPVDPTLEVNGDNINVPWCNQGTCEITSLVDIPGIIVNSLIDSLTPAGVQFLQGIEQVFLDIPTDGGIAGPVVLFLVVFGSVVGLVWLLRLAIALAPVSKP
jgi:hypothetical protein